MACYFKADDEAMELLAEVMADHHRERLVELGVTVALMVAVAEVDDSGKPVGPALKHNGYTALAVARVLPLKLRAHGLPDAEITIDGDRWTDMNSGERRALLDHDLTHLVPILKDGRVMRDDLGRPRLKMRLHDFQFGWFLEVAERHGECSQERKQAAEIIASSGQLLFDFTGRSRARTPLGAAMVDAIERLQEGAGEGNTVTLSAGGESVTLPGKAKKSRKN